MKMESWSANQLRDIDDYVNHNDIKKENIINVFQRIDGTFTVTYFTED